MSKSYKKIAIYKRNTKGMKKKANKTLRQKMKNIKKNTGNGSWYKKTFESYDICDFSWFAPKFERYYNGQLKELKERKFEYENEIKKFENIKKPSKEKIELEFKNFKKNKKFDFNSTILNEALIENFLRETSLSMKIIMFSEKGNKKFEEQIETISNSIRITEFKEKINEELDRIKMLIDCRKKALTIVKEELKKINKKDVYAEWYRYYKAK